MQKLVFELKKKSSYLILEFITMKYLTFFLAITIVAFFSSCSEQSHDSHSEHEEAEGHSHEKSDGHSHEEGHSHENYEVRLNEGEKWEANPETTEGIKAMQQSVNDFLAEESDKDFALLKEDLEMEFQNIFQKCTMTGEAHEQLHNYLLPMKHIFEELGSMDEALLDEKLGELQDHLAEYSNYFE